MLSFIPLAFLPSSSMGALQASSGSLVCSPSIWPKPDSRTRDKAIKSTKTCKNRSIALYCYLFNLANITYSLWSCEVCLINRLASVNPNGMYDGWSCASFHVTCGITAISLIRTGNRPGLWVYMRDVNK